MLYTACFTQRKVSEEQNTFNNPINVGPSKLVLGMPYRIICDDTTSFGLLTRIGHNFLQFTVSTANCIEDKECDTMTYTIYDVEDDEANNTVKIEPFII